MEVVILNGYYGYGNFGDDIMMDVIIQKLVNNFQIELIVFDKSKIDISKLNNKSLRIHETKYLKRIQVLFLYVNLFRNAKYFLWGGGTCFSDQDGMPNMIQLALARLFHLKIKFLGVGIGTLNLRSNRFKMKLISLLANGFYFRDRKSFDTFIALSSRNHKAFLTEDLAHLYEYHNSINKENSLTIILRGLDNYAQSSEQIKFIENIAFTVNNLNSIYEYHNIKIVIIDEIEDERISVDCYDSIIRLDSKLSNKMKLYKNKSVQWIYENLKNSQLIIGMRLHPIIISYTLGIRCVAISYSEKINRFFDEIKENNYLSVSDVIYNPKSLYNLSREIMNKKPVVINSNNYRKKALENFSWTYLGERYE